jgi:hypothetical protein
MRLHACADRWVHCFRPCWPRPCSGHLCSLRKETPGFTGAAWLRRLSVLLLLPVTSHARGRAVNPGIRQRLFLSCHQATTLTACCAVALLWFLFRRLHRCSAHTRTSCSSLPLTASGTSSPRKKPQLLRYAARCGPASAAQASARPAALVPAYSRVARLSAAAAITSPCSWWTCEGAKALGALLRYSLHSAASLC